MKIIRLIYLIGVLLCNNLCSVEIRYEQAGTGLFEPTIPAYVYKETIDCIPTNACVYYTNETYFVSDDCLGKFFQNFSIDSIETALNQNFDTECNNLLNEFLATHIYKQAKSNIEQFIAASLSDCKFRLDKAQLITKEQEQDKNYQWQYLHDENNSIIGVSGSTKTVFTISTETKSASQNDGTNITVESCFSFPLLKIIANRLCRLKNVFPYSLLVDISNPNQLIPAANLSTVDMTIQERPRFQLLITFANNKPQNDYVAFKADIFLGEKNSLIEEACHITNNHYYLAPINPNDKPKQFINSSDIDIQSSEAAPYIFYSLLHHKKRNCVVTPLDGVTGHNHLTKLEHIKNKLGCFSESVSIP